MMKYVITPSLERIAILKIASWLWNQNDIRDLIKCYTFPRYTFDTKENWQNIEDKVLEKVSNLQQPETLKEKIGGVARVVGLEILKWIMEYYNGFVLFSKNFDARIPSEFFLTQLGKIDNQRSAELLVKDETLCIEKRYRLACFYCLEDYVPDLWSKLPENSRHKFYNSNSLAMDMPEHFPTTFFPYYLSGELSKKPFSYRQSFYVQQLKQAIVNGNVVATEYFYKKLTLNDPEFSLLETIEKLIGDVMSIPNLVEVLCFLLAKMNEEDQIRVLRSSTVLSEFLLCMLDWPWQCFFIETITLMRSFIPQSVYEELLKKIIHKVIDGYKDCCYRDIFTELCMQIPNDERYHILRKVCASDSLLANLFKIKDKQNMKLIFQDTTPELKKAFIVSSNGISICCKLMTRGDWNLLELFILDCITTKDELVKLKENFHGIVRSALNFTDGWSKFVCLLDSLVCKYDKRKLEEEISTNSVKKVCNINLKNNG